MILSVVFKKLQVWKKCSRQHFLQVWRALVAVRPTQLGSNFIRNSTSSFESEYDQKVENCFPVSIKKEFLIVSTPQEWNTSATTHTFSNWIVYVRLPEKINFKNNS